MQVISIASPVFYILETCRTYTSQVGHKVAQVASSVFDTMQQIYSGAKIRVKKIVARACSTGISLCFSQPTATNKGKDIPYVFVENARFLSHYLIGYFKTYTSAAASMEKGRQPAWLQELVADNNSYTLTGEIVKTLIEEHGGLFQSYLESNFLKVFTTLRKNLQDMEQANPEMLVLIICEALECVAAHFTNPGSIERAQNQDLQNQKIKQVLERLLFCNNPQCIELPGPALFTEPLKKELYAFISESIIPFTLSFLFQLLEKKETRDYFLLQAFRLLKQFIDEEGEFAEVHDPTPSRYKDRLSSAIEQAIDAFLHYIDPQTKKRTFRYFSSAAIGALCRDALLKKCAGKSVTQGIEELCSLAPRLLDPQGAWKDDHFLSSGYRFPVTEAEFEKEAMKKMEAKEKVEAELLLVVSQMGQEQRGLTKIAQQLFSGSGQERNQEEVSRSSFSFLQAVRNLANTTLMTVKSTTISFSLRHVCRKVRALSCEIMVKMRQDEHEPFFSKVAKTMLSRGIF